MATNVPWASPAIGSWRRRSAGRGAGARRPAGGARTPSLFLQRAERLRTRTSGQNGFRPELDDVGLRSAPAEFCPERALLRGSALEHREGPQGHRPMVNHGDESPGEWRTTRPWCVAEGEGTPSSVDLSRGEAARRASHRIGSHRRRQSECRPSNRAAHERVGAEAPRSPSSWMPRGTSLATSDVRLQCEARPVLRETVGDSATAPDEERLSCREAQKKEASWPD